MSKVILEGWVPSLQGHAPYIWKPLSQNFLTDVLYHACLMPVWWSDWLSVTAVPLRWGRSHCSLMRRVLLKVTIGPDVWLTAVKLSTIKTIYCHPQDIVHNNNNNNSNTLHWWPWAVTASHSTWTRRLTFPGLVVGGGKCALHTWLLAVNGKSWLWCSEALPRFTDQTNNTCFI